MVSEIISKVFSPFFWFFRMVTMVIRKIFSHILSITLIVLLIIFGNDLRLISHEFLNNMVKSPYVQTVIKKVESIAGHEQKEEPKHHK